jgi:hypothetical protein
MRPRGIAVLAGVAALAAARPARADCNEAQVAWRALGGTLVSDATCDGVILTADGAGHTEAVAQLVDELAGDGSYAFTWQRLSADRGTLNAKFPGGTVLLRDGEIGLYRDEAHWQTTGFQPLPEALAGWREVDAVAVRIALAGDDVVVSLDGIVALRATIADRPRDGALVLSIVGEAGQRSRLRIVGARTEPVTDTRATAATGGARAASRTRAVAPRAGSRATRAPRRSRARR